MHLAYSAISKTNDNHQDNNLPQADNERMLRYQAYQHTCEKYRHEIAAIRKYLPGWQPRFR